ncbi:MAG: peptidoglycan D,D-transpeptidase FtsI family protein [Propionibacteriaceae bacterium]
MASDRTPHPSKRGAAKKTAARKPAAKKAPAKKAPAKATAKRTPAKRTSSQRRTTTGARSGPTRRPAAKRSVAKGRRKTTRIPLAGHTARLRVVLVVMAIAISLCAGRLLQLQGFDSSAYAATAARQMTTSLPLLPARGELTDRNGSVLAGTEPAVAITADPVHTGKNAAAIADVLVAHLDGDRDDYIERLSTPDTRFVYVQKKVPAAAYSRIATELNDKDLYGVFRESDPIRTYPNKSVGSGVVGFVGADGSGLGGFEYSMNDELTGTEGLEVYEASPNGNKIPLGTSVVTPAENGTNYELTLDSELQWTAEKRLQQQIKSAQAESGFVVVMSVKSGEVLAMANAPGYDPSAPGEADPADLSNRIVSDAYEPGSVQKVLTMSALIDQGLMSADTKVEVPGKLKSADTTITDVWSHGTMRLTARGILAQSSNIGTVLLARQSSKSKLLDYFQKFGLGQPTGIQLPGESAGYLPDAKMPDYTRDQISFGQGMSVSGIQMAAAIAGVVNDGVYNEPTIIRSATKSDGTKVPVDREEPQRVVSSETSAEIRSMMESVNGEGGSGEPLALTDYRSGGKSGTAERVDPECGCYRGYTASFLGMAPAEDPEILTYVVLQNPKAGNSGGKYAGPVYQDVMEYAMPRYSVLPSTSKGPSGGLDW